MKGYKRLTHKDDIYYVDVINDKYEIVCSPKSDNNLCVVLSAQKIVKLLNRLVELENAALRERLEKAVELPCKVRDKVYCIHGMSNPEMLEWQVNEIRITDHNYMLQLGRAGTKDYRNEASQFYGKWWFTSREAAEARLAELKGENNG